MGANEELQATGFQTHIKDAAGGAHFRGQIRLRLARTDFPQGVGMLATGQMRRREAHKKEQGAGFWVHLYLI